MAYRPCAWLPLALVCLLSTGSCGDGTAGPPCVLTQECSSLTVCQDSGCVAQSCFTNLDCPVDSICYPDQRLCGVLECRRQKDCQDIEGRPYCEGGRCQADPPAECRSRGQCGVSETCRSGACVDVPEGLYCNDSQDCGNPEVCDPNLDERGVCVPPCLGDDDCEPLDGQSRICETSSGLCSPAECLTRDDCQEFETCSPENECIVELFDCASLVCQGTDHPFKTEPIGGMCRCVQCLSSNHCSQTAQEVCTADKECLYCAYPEEEVSNCPSGHPYLEEGCCLQCRDNGHCESLGLGSICNHGRCVPCNCAAGCACPSGTVCQFDAEPGLGVCIDSGGDIGDSCLAQTDCRSDRACSYATGRCVEQGTGSFCTEEGCPEPSRCATRNEGALCYGCSTIAECPDGFFCYQPSGPWEYEGGLCLPSE